MNGAGILEQLLDEVRALREELAQVRAANGAQPELVTIQAYAAARSISVGKVRAAIASGELDAVHIGRAVRVRRDAEIARKVVADSPQARARRVLSVVRGDR